MPTSLESLNAALAHATWERGSNGSRTARVTVRSTATGYVASADVACADPDCEWCQGRPGTDHAPVTVALRGAGLGAVLALEAV